MVSKTKKGNTGRRFAPLVAVATVGRIIAIPRSDFATQSFDSSDGVIVSLNGVMPSLAGINETPRPLVIYDLSALIRVIFALVKIIPTWLVLVQQISSLPPSLFVPSHLFPFPPLSLSLFQPTPPPFLSHRGSDAQNRAPGTSWLVPRCRYHEERMSIARSHSFREGETASADFTAFSRHRVEREKKKRKKKRATVLLLDRRSLDRNKRSRLLA